MNGWMNEQILQGNKYIKLTHFILRYYGIIIWIKTMQVHRLVWL